MSIIPVYYRSSLGYESRKFEEEEEENSLQK